VGGIEGCERSEQEEKGLLLLQFFARVKKKALLLRVKKKALLLPFFARVKKKALLLQFFARVKKKALLLMLLFRGRSGQHLGLSGGDPPNPPRGQRGRST
jgi:hypothetical protein